MARERVISPTGRGIVFATISALALTTSASPLVAAPAAVSNGVSAMPTSSDATDFSAARRHRRYHRGPSAAGAAFMGMALGLAAGAIAAQQRREYYENYGYYYGPGHYGPGSYYGPRYYYPPY
ncbi:hypothetical protein [Bradyrhizobium sp. ARR65]|uniref:hypothetical protein n=1 Tax=Bradyrhizobium sp. ARR65 TaxID=1040989 RepID=UPI000463A07D|nr:hypothetical protein [Bradyrhizobium sp. ARR65]